MAYQALTSLSESIKPGVNFYTVFETDALRSLDDRVRLSLDILNYLSKRFNNDERLKILEEKIRIKACEAEYSIHMDFSDSISRYSLLSKAIEAEFLLSKADDIELLSTDLLKTLGPNFLVHQEQLSYVVSSLAINSYEVHHEFVENRSSPNWVEKNEIVDFLIAGSKLSSELGLVGISDDGTRSDIEKRSFARYIYTDSRMRNWFPIHAWGTSLNLGPFYSRGSLSRGSLRGLISSVIECFPGSETYQLRLDQMSFQQLHECLYKHLEDKRYFIVIEDLEGSLNWNYISYYFPDQKNGSRILFTNDIEMVQGINLKTDLVLSRSDDFGIRQMFHNLVFGDRSCPEELEIVVLNILNICQGSTCEVFMVAKYLSTIHQSIDNWLIVQESIEKNACVFKDPTLGIISALLKASAVTCRGDRCLFEKGQTKNKLPDRFKDLKASSEVIEAKDHEKVGLEECLDQLVPELLCSSPQLEKLAIAGMAGIGKTTLAKRIFDDPSICSRFHIRVWIGISQIYEKRSLLIQVLHGITQLTDNEILNETDYQLEEKVYKCLKGQRYLIIMDDMWSIKAWSELESIFPDDKLGSRILLTSRESNLIQGLNCKIVHRMSLLSEEKSWDLLQKKVFGQEICPQGFAVIGKQIASGCKGLPLAVVVVAGVLLKIDKTLDSWKVVAESVSSHVMCSENAPRALFALSYEHLPDYLKPCFLYMGAFPGGYEIEVRILVRLWIAEGFIANPNPKCMEDVAEEYLNDLIDRSLLLSGRRRSNGRLKTCRLHDLVLEFCVQEARREKFLDVIKDFRQLDSEAAIDGHHRFSFHCHTFDDVHLTASKSLAGSALVFGVSSHLVPDILLYYFDFKLLRVLDLISWRFDTFPTEQIAKLLLLRYLALTASFEIPGILFNLQKLQTLIINGPWLKSFKTPKLPREIWRCTSLRHLHLRVVNNLWPPATLPDAKRLEFLQTLTNITLASCTRNSFSSIPNIIELGVCETHEDFPVVGDWDSFFQNLILLKRIQTLKISCSGHNRPMPLPSLDAFPKGLKNLTLRQSNLPWEAMASIGDLPNLEVLKLRNNAFRGPKWETREGGFQNLKYLLIEETNLMYWEVESHDHFPHLEQLVLKFCEVLEEIPAEIGDIQTLTHIKVEYCCSSLERSAKNIQEQCNEFGQNIEVQVRTQQTL